MDNEMRKMQQEAVHRVQEMQSRAQKHLQEEPKQKIPPEEKILQTSQESGMTPATLLDGLMKDSERTLILLLILLLFTENADTSVIFSLLYLIL